MTRQSLKFQREPNSRRMYEADMGNGYIALLYPKLNGWIISIRKGFKEYVCELHPKKSYAIERAESFNTGES